MKKIKINESQVFTLNALIEVKQYKIFQRKNII